MSNWYHNSKTDIVSPTQNVPIRIDKLCCNEVIDESTKRFLRSLRDQHTKNNGLTKRQLGALEEIELSITPEALEKHKVWISEFDDMKKEIMVVCAEYYKDSNYFYLLSDRISRDDGYIPTENEYNSLCLNKYSARVIEAGHKSVTSAAKGAKPYLVLPFGATVPIDVEERHIKKMIDKSKKIK